MPLESEWQALRCVAADSGRPLGDRIAALEEMTDTVVGDTPLTRARGVEQHVSLRQIYLKTECGNPTGTHRDRLACAQVLDALRRGFAGITLASRGDLGAATSFAASLCALPCTVLVPSGVPSRRTDEIMSFGAGIVRVPGDYETALAASREQAEREGMYDGNPGGPNTDLQLSAYTRIADEIYDELRDAPAAIAAPMNTGMLIAGIERGFASLYRRGRTSRIPRIIAASHDAAPIRSAITPPQRDLTRWSRSLREKEGIGVWPAATMGLYALAHRHRLETQAPDRYVVVITSA